jgi:polyhydroxybutyrate depolymerase
MSRLIAALAIVTLCIVGIDRSACAETMQLVVDGQPRTYLLERPKAQRPSPTIIVLHGSNGTSERIAQRTGLSELAPQEGFAAVFPQARAIVWNRFPPGRETRQAIEFFGRRGGLPNDVGFLKMLVADLVRRGVSDPARIYLAGFSNGGFMALAMICGEAGLFAGAGVVIASMTEQTGEDCRPAVPLPVVMLHGTADVIVPYGGGAVAPLGPRQASTLKIWSAERLASFFRRLNGCEGQPERSVLPADPPRRIEMERSTRCAGGPVIAYRVVGGTHASTPEAMSIGRMLLDFFRGKTRTTRLLR